MSLPQLIPFDSDLYPLPEDYYELTTEGQRLARVAACRQWLIPVDAYPGRSHEQRLENKTRAYVSAVNFFDRYYLYPQEGFDPVFYTGAPPVEPAPFHNEILRQFISSQRANLIVCPRGSAKTTVNRKDIIFRLATALSYSFVYATSSSDNSKATGEAVRTQLYDNQRIFDDFGRFKPARGEKPTGIEFFYLKNGSWLRCISASSKQRGIRPDRYRLDDPEYDPRASTSMSILRDYMETLIFKVILPMVMKQGSGVDWLATFVSRRHYAWKAMSLKPGTGNAEDSRFDWWNRLLVRAEMDTPTGPVSCWPDMWPLTIKDKLANPRLKDRVSLEEIRQLIGTAAYNAEYRGQPGELDHAFFPDLSTQESRTKLFFTVGSPDEAFESNPRISETPITVHRLSSGGLWEPLTFPISHLLSRCHLFITVDTSYTNTATSDYKACTCMAYEPTFNEIWVLDHWCARASESALIRAIFQMSDRWKVHAIYPEVVKGQVHLYRNIEHHLNTKAQTSMGFTHTPRLVPLKPGFDSKAKKIEGSLGIRFEHGLIKFPSGKRHSPYWIHLFDQIEGFNPEANDLGLDNDDSLDTVSMSYFVVRGRKPQEMPELPPSADVLELLQAGHRKNPLGVNLGIGLNLDVLTPDDVSLIYRKEPPNAPRSLV